MAVSRLLDVLERLQHFGDEVFADLDEAGMFRLLLRADELAVRALKVALDGVVLEVVDGLGLVLHVLFAAAGGSRRRRGRLVLSERGGWGSRQSDPSEESETDDEWRLHDSVLLVLREARLPGYRQRKAPAVPIELIFFRFSEAVLRIKRKTAYSFLILLLTS